MFTFPNKEAWEEFIRDGMAKDGVVSVILSSGIEADILQTVISAADGFDPSVEDRWHLLIPNFSNGGLSFARDTRTFKFNYALNEDFMDRYEVSTNDLPQLLFLDVNNECIAASIILADSSDTVRVLRDVIAIVNRHMAESQRFDKKGSIKEIGAYADGRRIKSLFHNGKKLYDIFRG